jgi:pimeloyl-ACP methyl ester carboxylesterase
MSPITSVVLVLAVIVVILNIVISVLTFPMAYNPILPVPDSNENPKGRLILWQSLSIYICGVPPSREGSVVMFSHGNGFCLANSRLHFDDLAHAFGTTLVTWDYPGYGASAGRPSEGNVYRAAHDVLGYIERDMGVPAERVILVGHSLGTAPTLHLATGKAFQRVILLAPFRSILKVVLPFGLPFLDLFDNEAMLQQSTDNNDIFIYQGMDDKVIRPAKSLSTSSSVLQIASNIETIFLNDVGHDDIVSNARVIASVQQLRSRAAIS